MEGRIFSYVHFNGQVGSLVKIATVTDFAAKTDEFIVFGKDIAMQVANNKPKDYFEFYEQPFIKDSSKTVKMLFDEMSKLLGEKVEIIAFTQFDFRG